MGYSTNMSLHEFLEENYIYFTLTSDVYVIFNIGKTYVEFSKKLPAILLACQDYIWWCAQYKNSIYLTSFCMNYYVFEEITWNT